MTTQAATTAAEHLMQVTAGGDCLVHFATRNVIHILMEMLFDLLKKNFWCHQTKINDFGMKTFHGQKCIVVQAKTMF